MIAQQVTDSRTPRRRRSHDEAVDGLEFSSRRDSRRILASLAGRPAELVGMEVVV